MQRDSEIDVPLLPDKNGSTMAAACCGRAEIGSLAPETSRRLRRRAFRMGGGERLNQKGGISPRAMGNFPYGLFSDLRVGCECSFFHKFYELLVLDLTYRNEKGLWH